MTGTKPVLSLALASCLLLTACGDLLSTTVTFTGRVRLPDNPPEGCGGVAVSTGAIMTLTDSNGSFSISGKVVYDAHVTITFSKVGYTDRTLQRYVEPGGGDRTIDLGVVVVRKPGVNTPPNPPSTPSGPAEGWLGNPYDFASSAEDLDADSVALRFAWGDGDTSDWGSLVASGFSYTVGHTYHMAGDYSITAQAEDQWGARSDWSDAARFSAGGYPNRVVATIPVAAGPGEVACLPNGEFVYVACAFDSSVSVIRTSDNTVVATVPGIEPSGVAATPDGQLVYVANRGRNNVTIVRTSNDSIEHALTVYGRLGACLALPDGSSVYVTGSDSNYVAAINTSSRTVKAYVPVEEEPWGMAALPNSQYIYVTNHNSANVSVIGTSSNQQVATISVREWPESDVASPDGQYVYVAHGLYTGAVSVIRTSDNVVAATVPVGSSPSGIAVLPAGDYLYVSDHSTGEVYVIRTSDLSVIDSVYIGGGLRALVAAPDGSSLYVSDESDNAVTVIGY
jgi:YVTN family beta-propeller protein